MTERDTPLAHVQTVVESVMLPWSTATFQITRPASIDDLLDRAELDPEQNLPYFAEIWPSGIALADLLMEQPGFVANRRTLEVGCGLGITAVAAARSGARLTICDYFPESIELAARNLVGAGCVAQRAVELNWRDPRSIAALLDSGPYPIVLAADVLYEARDIAPLLTFFAQALTVDGTLFLAEPGRPVAKRFLEAASEHGWDVGEIATHGGPWPDPKDRNVTVSIHTLRRT
jgi:predicted nicotinamide N-methyase